MEATVKQELSLFLNKQISADSLCCVDDIVLGYIVSVLEQLGEDEQFDVDEFAEIMAAYIPGFDTVKKEDVCDWMLGLADKLVNTRTSNNQTKEDKTLTENKDLSSPSGMPANDNHAGNASDGFSSSQRQESCTSGGKTPLSPGCMSTHPNQETANGTQKDKAITDNASDAVSVLAELFPEACSLELEHCLRVANGDTESAVQLMLLKGAEDYDEEGKENCRGILDFSPKAHLPSAKRQEPQKTDQVDLKEQMMARYGYVDVSQDEKTHQPVFNKQESKKLVRYRNNQVVSTKGERFSWEKQEESQEMKKTYVNLKPARKYRFH